MNKKDLLDNIRDYSPKEIADAIKSGIVTFYELKSGTHGQFTPMLQRQVQQKLAEKEESATNTQSEASQTQEEVFAPEEAVTPTRPAEPEPFKPIEPEPETETAWHPEPEPQPVQIRLIPCPECGWLVSPRATECPSCGMPLSGGSPSCHAPAFDTVQQTQQQVPTPPADYKFVTPTETQLYQQVQLGRFDIRMAVGRVQRSKLGFNHYLVRRSCRVIPKLFRRSVFRNRRTFDSVTFRTCHQYLSRHKGQ